MRAQRDQGGKRGAAFGDIRSAQPLLGHLCGRAVVDEGEDAGPARVARAEADDERFALTKKAA